MNRLRKSFRDSFRRKKDRVPESSKPHQWEEDERAVRSGECSFPIKYLGCVEVFDSRGMHICEEALKILRSSRRKPIKGVLHVTGDGLRVVDDDKRGLLVDQTIEKVSFCAPDRFNEKGFSYICRDGATRRWMCHGFHASKDSGERLSHAVGCAFAVCLEKKQKRDRDLAVSMQFDTKTSAFTRNGSFRQSTITERLKDPQVAKPAAPPPVKPVSNPFAIERPHAAPHMLERQGSFRGFSSLSQASPFKRQLSLRLSELPSTVERQRAHSLATNNLFSAKKVIPISPSPESLSPPKEATSPIHHPVIPETSDFPKSDSISEMCKELSKGLEILSQVEEPFPMSPSKDIRSYDSQSSTPKLSPTKSPISTPVPTPPPRPLPDLSSRVRSPPALPTRKPPPPPLSQLRSSSLGTPSPRMDVNVAENKGPMNESQKPTFSLRRPFPKTTSLDISSLLPSAPTDPFDTEWAASIVTSPDKANHPTDMTRNRSTNPFATNGSLVKTFEVQL